MKRGIWFTILTILLTAAVVVLPMIQASLTEQPPTVTPGVEKSKHNIVESSEETKTQQKDDNTGLKDETVQYFVTLTEPALIDTYLSLGNAYADIRTLLLSTEGKSYADTVKRSQAVAKASIKKLVPDSDFTGSRTLSALWNGMTFRAPLSVRDKIAKINGVANVYVLSDEWYCLDELTDPTVSAAPVTDETILPDTAENTDSENTPAIETALRYAPAQTLQKAYREQIEADGDLTAAYQGQGTLIAVIDSEFDTADPVFSHTPETGVWTPSLLSTLSRYIRLNITEKQQIESCYISPKIIYAYDYAEMDYNTADPDLYHGTLTAAIAAGHNGETGDNAYQGIAPEAQLALMKIASARSANGRITVQTAALLAALDDAVKLGADAVNLSFGSENLSANSDLYQTAFQKLQKAGIALFAAAGNSGYNGQTLGQELQAGDIFYGTQNTLAAMPGVTSVGAVQSTLHVRHFITIGDTKLYYRSLSDVPLTDILHYAEPTPTPSEESSDLSDISAESSTDISEISTIAESSLPYETSLSTETAETSDISDTPTTLPQQHNEYFYINPNGRTTVLHEADVKGRLLILDVSLIKNWPATLQEAANKGAAAIALMNLDDTDVPIHYGMPFLVLEENYTNVFLQQPTGTYEMDLNDELTENPSAGRISDFTSYSNVQPSALSRMMAPGEDIYAAVSDNGRSLLTGTSAAAPGITGAYVILKQYLSDLSAVSELSPAEKEHIAQSLLLSTAAPLSVSDTAQTKLYASPRVQGFGLLQLDKALRANAYLSTDSQSIEAVPLRIQEDGTCQFSFTLHNLSKQTHTYVPHFVLQTDRLQSGINTLRPRSLTTEAAMRFAINDNPISVITIKGGRSAEISATLTIKSAMLSTLQEEFPSGCYLDGYLLLIPLDLSPRLSLPLTGFYQPTSSYTPFDNTIYDEDESFIEPDSYLTAVAYRNNAYQSTPLLSYQNHLLYSPEAIRTVTDNNNYGISFILPDIYPLCDLYDYTITLYNSSGKSLYSENYGTVSAYREKDKRPFEKLLNGNKGLRECFLHLDSGTYRYEIAARMRQPEGNLSAVFRKSYSFVMDTEKPKVLSAQTVQQDGRTILSLTAKDTNGLQGFTLYAAAYDSQKKKYDYLDNLDTMIQAGYLAADAYTLIGQQNNEDGSQTFRYDVTNLPKELRKLSVNTQTWSTYCLDERIAFKAIDNAYNASSVSMADAIEFGSASFRFTDQDGNPAKGIRVTIDHTTVTSNKDGVAYFDHLAPNYYHAILHYTTEDYRIETTDYLVSILPDRLHYSQEQTVTALKPYIPEETPSPETVSYTSAPSATEDDPLYAFFFVGTFLTICIILFLFRKIRE